MNTVHKPVLMDEVIEALNPKANQNFIDGTLGGGGHAEEILKRTGPKGKVLGLDWDNEAVLRTKERLSDYGERLIPVNSSYINLKEVIQEEKFHEFSGILLDLGLSSDQLQISGRGFSFQKNEPLDMRFDAGRNELTAEIILNTWTEDKIEEIIREYGEDSWSRKIAKTIVERRQESPIKTTLDLVGLLIGALPKKKSKTHPATKTFQALRIAVNNELNNVRLALKDMINMLEPGSRLAVITFHSLEDRIVKQYFKQESIDCHCPPEIPVCRCEHKAQAKLITKKAVKPTDKEITENFRCRSAKLRVVEKI
jgi:16S rRNA (cytosine1402-N4)-methyltransferase